MATDLERAMQAGGQIQEETDLQRAISGGGQVQESDRGAIPFINRAIAGTLGAPVDIAAAGLSLIPGVDIQEPLGGAESITGGFEALGIPTAPQAERPATLREQIGAGVGEGVSMLLPFTKTAQLASRGTGTVGRVSKVIWDGIRKHPFITGVTEVTAGAGTGIGRELAETTDRPELRTAFEVGGSLVGGFTPVALTYTPVMVGGRITRTLLKKASLPFTEAGSKFRAGQFIKGQVVDPSLAAEKVTGETIGSLPPAVASGEKRLMALYNQFRTADPVTDADAVKKMSHSIYQLEQELRGLGYGAPEILENVTRRRVASLQLNMDKRVASAMEVADNKLSALPVAQRQSKESVIVRNELEKVMRSEDELVKDAWKKVRKDIAVDPVDSKTAYRELIKTTPKAQLDDIPEVLKRSFVAKKKVKHPINVNEMQGLRSKLLEVQRIAKKDGQWNKARIAGDMANSLLDDMATEGADGPLQVAIASTRKFKQRFQSGIVGKILGHAKSGEPSIPPELTIDVSIGRSGISGAVDIDKVAVTPEARAATRRYLSRSFTDFVTDKGTKDFNVTKAEKWVTSNEEVLDQFPELRVELQDVAGAQQHASTTAASMAAKRKQIEDPRVSMTARFLASDPGKEIDRVFKSHDPVKTTKDLITKAGKDASGEALEGLKSSYIDYFIDKSSIGAFNEVGEQTISGKKLLSLIGENNGVMREIFAPEEISRIRKIGDELVKLEIAEGRLKGVPIELEDTASSFLRMVSRVGGAQMGRWVARMTGGGTVQTPGIFSERFQNFAKHLTKDRAFQLIHEAVTVDDGGKLLNSLLLPIDKPTLPKGQSHLEELNKRVNVWLLGTGSRIMRDIAEEQREDEIAELEALTGVQ